MIKNETIGKDINHYQIQHPLIGISAFLWIGFVCAISFMEAWLKFRAPGVTLPLGLGIGCMVYEALNKVEWLLAAIIAVTISFKSQKIITIEKLPYLIPVLILIYQTFWLLPALTLRAHIYMEGIQPPSSTIHIQYVVAELTKVICLIYFGLSQFKKTTP